MNNLDTAKKILQNNKYTFVLLKDGRRIKTSHKKGIFPFMEMIRDHSDMMEGAVIADKVIVFSGEPAIETTASKPETTNVGLNKFLKKLNITFRKDGSSGRPRINKLESAKDNEQKKKGMYYC